jgi:hypothetical protein
MLKLCFCLLLPVFAAHAASIGNFFVDALAGPNPGEFATDTQELQEDLVFTVTSGPAQGFFQPCLDVSEDWFQGEARGFASFGRISVSASGQGTFGTCGDFVFPTQSFTLGVPQTATLSLSAFATAGSLDPDVQAQAGASARLDGFLFFDYGMNLVSGVTYSLVGGTVAVPEPATGFLLLGVLVVFRRMNGARQPQPRNDDR